jgi:hypothetical protein
MAIDSRISRFLQIGRYRLKLGDAPTWGFDSEFLMSGGVGVAEDVHSVQFSNGDLKHSVVLESGDDLRSWLDSHANIKILYGFNVLCDLGSVRVWLGDKAVTAYRRGLQLVGQIRYKHFKAKVFDAMPLCQALAMRRLEDCGVVVGVEKKDKPEWLGQRRWESAAEHREFIEYALSDAVITALIVRWLRVNYRADPQLYASIASVAAETFSLPRRFKRRGRKKVVDEQVSGVERMVKNNTFAGRSEGFVTGFIPNAVYNDAKILYGVDCAITHALEIFGADECSPKDLSVGFDTPLDDVRFGWLEGIFETENDLFGLPLRARNNLFVVGRLQGLFSTFDLNAAKAKVLSVSRAFKLVFEPRKSHADYVDMLLDVLEGRMDKVRERYAKGILRGLTGKFAEAKPVISPRANFFAYHAIVSHAHFLMSKMFDRCVGLGGKIYAMDTDSVFSNVDLGGKFCELSDGERSIPVLFAVKARGDLVFFRSKNYLLRDKDSSFESAEKHEGAYGRHHWAYFKEDFKKLFDGVVTELFTRKDIKHTLRTATAAALEMEWGRWLTKPEHLDLAKIKELVWADTKRKRENGDSYGLVMAKKNVSSVSWGVAELLRANPNLLDYPKIEKRGKYY